MTRSIQEIRIAEGDVLRAGGNEPANVFENDALGHHEKPTVVNRRNRTMGTEMQAASARFDVPHQPLLAPILEFGVMLQRHERAAVGCCEINPSKYGLQRIACPTESFFCDFGLF